MRKSQDVQYLSIRRAPESTVARLGLLLQPWLGSADLGCSRSAPHGIRHVSRVSVTSGSERERGLRRGDGTGRGGRTAGAPCDVGWRTPFPTAAGADVR